MLIKDYGKMAYAKLYEIENKIAKLEKTVSENITTELNFNYGEEENIKSYEKTFTFNSKKKQTAVMIIESDFLLTGGAVACVSTVTANGNSLTSFYIRNGVKTQRFSVVLSEGENQVFVSVECNNNFTVKSFKVTFVGVIEYNENEEHLSYANLRNGNYLLSQKNGYGELFYYNGTNGLVSVVILNGIFECRIVKATETQVNIIAVDTEKRLKYFVYNNLEDKLYEYNLGVNSVSSACGHEQNGVIEIYFCKLSEVYKGRITESSGIIYERTGKSGIKVYADANTENAIIIVDKYKNATLVTN